MVDTFRALARWQGNRTVSNRLALGLLPAGLLAFVVSLLVPPQLGYRHLHLAIIPFYLGFVAWTGAVLHAVSRWTAGLHAVRWLSTMGRETLLLYVAHHLVGFRLLSPAGWVTGRSWRGQYGTLEIWQATLLLFALWVGLYRLTDRWMAWKRTHAGFRRIANALF